MVQEGNEPSSDRRRNVAAAAISLARSVGFRDSSDYWKRRYEAGGDSRAGSYGELANFKAGVINRFVSEHKVKTVIEFGCGDGNQLLLAEYPEYLGFDISPDAVQICKRHFAADSTKSFRLVDDYDEENAELALSLDVIYHLVEDPVFEAYMDRLFRSADRFVIIYSSNTDQNPMIRPPHVRHRAFSKWVDNLSNWTLEAQIPNRLPSSCDSLNGSFADFWIYRKLLQ